MLYRRLGLLNFIKFCTTLFIISTAIIFGGGPNNLNFGFSLLFASASALVFLTALSRDIHLFSRAPLLLNCAIGSIVLLPLIQLIPLPPEVWQSIPGHTNYLEVRQSVGLSNKWYPATLDPQATLETFLFLVPPVAIFIGTFTLPRIYRNYLLIVIASLALISIIIGSIQVVTDGALMNFYNSSHRRFLLGFFANRNHQAIFLVLAFCIIMSKVRESQSRDTRILITELTVVIVFIVSVIATFSRSGFILLLLALSSHLITRESFRVRFPWGNKVMRKRNLLVGLLILSSMTAAIFLFDNPLLDESLARFRATDDPRFLFWPKVTKLALDFLPLGSGLGTFVPLYASYEQLEDITPFYLNHAHNDYLELLIEAGVLGSVVLGLFLWANFLGVKRLGGHPERSVLLLLFMVPLAVVLHSFVDYPIRTQAVACTLSVVLADIAHRIWIPSR